MQRLPTTILAAAASLMLYGCPDNNGGEPKVTYKGQVIFSYQTDSSGPWLAAGDGCERAFRDFTRDVNAQGGVAGYELVMKDIENHGYQVDPALENWDSWRQDPGWPDVDFAVVLGTGMTTALNTRITEDKISVMPVGTSPVFVSPTERTFSWGENDTQMSFSMPGAPYVFLSFADYTTAGLGLLNYMIQDTGGPPAVVLHTCGLSVCQQGVEIPAAQMSDRIHAADSLLEFGFSATAEEVDGAIKAYFDATDPASVDWLFMSPSSAQTVPIAKALAKYAPNVKAMIWWVAFTEAATAACDTDCDGRLFGNMPVSVYGDTRFPGQAEIVALNKKYRAEDGEDYATYAHSWYAVGNLTMRIFAAAIEAAASSGTPDRAGIHAALQQLNNVGVGGITEPISYSNTDHRPNRKAYVYSVGDGAIYTYEGTVELSSEQDWYTSQ